MGVGLSNTLQRPNPIPMRLAPTILRATSTLLRPCTTSSLNTFFRWTTGYGEDYDYDSIMHYSARAFVKDRTSKHLF